MSVSAIWNSLHGGFSMNIDLNADVGEGFASDSELLTLVSSAASLLVSRR